MPRCGVGSLAASARCFDQGDASLERAGAGTLDASIAPNVHRDAAVGSAPDPDGDVGDDGYSTPSNLPHHSATRIRTRSSHVTKRSTTTTMASKMVGKWGPSSISKAASTARSRLGQLKRTSSLYLAPERDRADQCSDLNDDNLP